MRQDLPDTPEALASLVTERGSIRQVAARIGMPSETLRDWCAGRRGLPKPYVLQPVIARIARLPVMRAAE